MDDETYDYRPYSGAVQWPRNSAELRDTTLSPEGFRTIRDPRYTDTGLDLTHPAVTELAAISRQAADLLDRRVQLIGRIRYESALAATAGAASAQPPVPPAAAPVPARVPSAPPAVAEPRRSGVQIFLLVTGIVLVTITAIFFLTVAYLVASDESRAVLTVALALGMLGTAWLLRVRSLPGTAEGLAWLGLVVATITVFFIRASGAFGTDDVDRALVIGTGVLLVGALGIGHHALTRVRAGLTLGVAAVPIGGGVLFTGIVRTLADINGVTSVWLALIAIAASGVLRPALPRLERTVFLLPAWIAGTISALLVPFVGGATDAGRLVCAAVTVAVLLALTVRGHDSAWRRWAAIATGIAISGTVLTMVPMLHLDGGTDAVWVWSAAWSLGIIAVLGVGRLLPGTAHSLVLWVVAPVALGASGSALVPLGWVGVSVLGLARNVFDPWRSQPGTVLSPGGLSIADSGALIALVCLSLAALGAVLLTRAPRAWYPLPVALTLLALLYGCSLAPTPIWIVVSGTVLAGITLAGARLVSYRPVQITLWVGFGAAAVLVQLAALSSRGIWLWAALTVVALLVVARIMLDHRRIAGAAVSGIAASLLLIDSAFFVEALVLPPVTGMAHPAIDHLFWPAVLAIIGLAAVSVTRLLPAGDALVLAGVTGFTLITASAALTPVQVSLLVALLPVGGAVLVAALLAAVGDRLPKPLHLTVGSSALLVAIITGLTGLTSDAPLNWLPVLLASAVPVLVASSREPVIRGARPVRQVAWLSLVLAVAALWSALDDARVDQLEAYTLPLAGALVIIAALLALRAPATDFSIGRTVILGSGLAIGLVPSAVASLSGSIVRPLVVLGVAGAIVVAGTLLPALWRGVGLRLALTVSALSALAVASSIMSVDRLSQAVEPWFLAELWLLPVLAAIVLVAVRGDGLPIILPRIALLTGVLLVASFTILAILGDQQAGERVVIGVTTLGVLSVAAAYSSRPVFSRLIELSAVSAAAVLVAVFAVAEPNRAVELASAPLAAALLVAGVRRLRRDATTRSWPTLGAGLGVLLLPSLLYDLDPQDQELWRVVALGVVALAVMIAGLMPGWQAPFLAGGAVLIVHGIAQLWPWIRAVYEAVYWWVWLGFGGVILIVLAATWELQLRSARRVGGRIGAMR